MTLVFRGRSDRAPVHTYKGVIGGGGKRLADDNLSGVFKRCACLRARESSVGEDSLQVRATENRKKEAGKLDKRQVVGGWGDY